MTENIKSLPTERESHTLGNIVVDSCIETGNWGAAMQILARRIEYQLEKIATCTKKLPEDQSDYQI